MGGLNQPIKELFSIHRKPWKAIARIKQGRLGQDQICVSKAHSRVDSRTRLSLGGLEAELVSRWAPKKASGIMYPYRRICILPTGGQNYTAHHQRLLSDFKNKDWIEQVL